jgi:hypothetical protein
MTRSLREAIESFAFELEETSTLYKGRTIAEVLRDLLAEPREEESQETDE